MKNSIGAVSKKITPGAACLPQLVLIPLFLLILYIGPAHGAQVGIVYSESSANAFEDDFFYSQLFMNMQYQAMMAGVPFELLSENDLTDINKISNLDALCFPGMQYIPASIVDAVTDTLTQAVFTYKVGIITAGKFLTDLAEGGSVPGAAETHMQSLLGLERLGSYDSSAILTAATTDNPAMKNYTPGETILSYEYILTNYYGPTLNNTLTSLAHLEMDEGTFNGVVATETGGRNVHFAHHRLMGDANLLWSALQWVLYGDTTPVALKPSRNKSIFLSRNDMDQSMYAESLYLNDIPLLDLLEQWKEAYNFVGSYYINVGNNPSNGEYTNWAVSEPLFTEYIYLGNEIGTHSYTHPDYTSNLSAAELEFQFNQSAMEINDGLGIEVVGAAIPGNPETLAVDREIDKYLSYVSGRYGSQGYGYRGMGYLTPDFDMLYFSYNLSADYSLIEWLNHTPSEAKIIWKQQLDSVANKASQPIFHWLWHDYAPTESANLYTVDLFTDTIAYAHNTHGSEFVTLDDMHKRIKSFQASSLQVQAQGDVISIDVGGNNVGQFSVEVSSDQVIQEIDNWYAYNDHQLFLPQNGGQFQVLLGSSQNDITRITSLPMRAKLLSLEGDGENLNFAFTGEGKVLVTLNSNRLAAFNVSGADSFSLNDNVLELEFIAYGSHTCSITASSGNSAPIAYTQTVTTQKNTAIDTSVTASDPDGDTLTYTLVSSPANGTVSGTLPDFRYTPQTDFTGADSLTFKVNDGNLDSNTVTVTITVIETTTNGVSNPANGITIDGNIDEWSTLTSFGHDPDDVSGSDNLLDWLECWMAHDDQNFYLAYRNDGPITLNWAYNLYIDSDQNTSTGSQDSLPIGVEYLIQENHIYAYSGDGSSWNWTYLGSGDVAMNGDTLEISFPRTLLGNPSSMDLIFLGENSAYTGGSMMDAYPDGIYVDGSENSFFSYSTSIIAPPANSAPIANTQTVATQKSTTIDITVTASDLDGDTVTYTLLSGPGNGTLSGTLPDVSYAPQVDFTGADSFTFKVNDGNLDSNTATVTITVIETTTNGVSNPANGITIDGRIDEWSTLTSFGYDPDDISGTDNLLDWLECWVAHDDQNFYLAYRNDGPITLNWAYNLYIDSDQNTVTGSKDGFPIGVEYLIQENHIYAYSGDGSSWNWTYLGSGNVAVNGNTLEISFPRTLLGNPITMDLFFLGENSAYTGGSMTDAYPDGVYEDDSENSFFTYSTMSTPPVNSPPLSYAQAVTTEENKAMDITVTASDPDGDTLTYTLVSSPSSGTVSGMMPDVSYTPQADFTGADSFTFKVNDGNLDSNTATVTITVTETTTNTAPLAYAQAVTTEENTAMDITVAASDPDGDTLTYTLVSSPANGTLSGTIPDVSYTPQTDFTGADSFTFKVNDGNLDSNTATVTITVIDTTTNTAPLAYAQAVTTEKNTALDIAVTATDPDGDTLTYTLVSAPANGTLSGTLPDVSYTPQAGFTGADSFTFKVNDGDLDSNTATVTITVTETTTNTVPLAYAQAVTTEKNMALDITVTAIDSDGDTLTYTLVSAPANGTLSGTLPDVSYTPQASFTGADSFTFKVNDGNLDSNTVTVTITVVETTTNGASNPGNGITIDGRIDEWSTLTSFGSDPDDINAAADLLDWLECWMAHDDQNFYFAYRNDGPITLNWAYNLYIDSDQNGATGFRDGFPIGAEYLIQENHIYAYSGDGSSWGWTYLGSGNVAINGDTLEISFPRTLLGNPSTMNLLFVGENSAYTGGSMMDTYPDGVYDSESQDRYFSYTTQ